MKEAWEILYNLVPSGADLEQCETFLIAQTASLTTRFKTLPVKKDEPKPDPEREAMASLCQILYSSNRFLYIE